MMLDTLLEQARSIRTYRDAYKTRDAWVALTKDAIAKAEAHGVEGAIEAYVRTIKRCDVKVRTYLDEGSLEMARAYAVKITFALLRIQAVLTRFAPRVKPQPEPVVEMVPVVTRKTRRKQGRPFISLADRLLPKIDTSGECHLWTGSIRHGRGRFYLTPGVSKMAHVVAYEFYTGEVVGPGETVEQTCENWLCCRREHLVKKMPALVG